MGPKGKPADAGTQMQMMQERMDMMQMMIQTMMDQHEMMAGPAEHGRCADKVVRHKIAGRIHQQIDSHRTCLPDSAEGNRRSAGY